MKKRVKIDRFGVCGICFGVRNLVECLRSHARLLAKSRALHSGLASLVMAICWDVIGVFSLV